MNLMNKAIALLQQTKRYAQDKTVLAQALHHWQNGDAIQALVLLTAASVCHPTDGLVWAVIAIIQAEQNEKEAVLQAVDRAHATEPTDGITWTLLANALQHVRQFERAMAACERALQYEPNQTWTWVLKGLALLKIGQHDAAVVAMETALRKQPNDGEIYAWLAKALRHCIRYTEAERVARQAVQLTAGNALAWGTLARRAAWIVIVAVSALFFAWAETRLYITQAASGNVWYVDLGAMLIWGSVFYSLYFVVSFPNIFRMDEEISEARWSLSRTCLEASAAGAISLLLIDLWAGFLGPIL